MLLGNSARLIQSARRQSGLLVPVLATTPQGSNTGGAISAGAAGFCLLFDVNGSGTIPALISGSWNSIATVQYSTVISARLSWKVVTNGESVDPQGTSRSLIRIYSNVDAADPIDDVQTNSGTDACDLPALTISEGGRLVVGFVRRAGTGDVPWASPIGEEAFSQNTTAVSSGAQSDGLLSSFAGMSMSVGNNDHVGIVLALNGAAA